MGVGSFNLGMGPGVAPAGLTPAYFLAPFQGFQFEPPYVGCYRTK